MSFRKRLQPHLSRVRMNRYQPRRERHGIRVWKDTQQNHPHPSSGQTWFLKFLIAWWISSWVLCAFSHHSWGRSMAQWEVGFLIEPFWCTGGWGARGDLMRPGPVFILTFLPQLYRCPSSDLKGRYGLVALLQRCQTSPSSSTACDIFTLMEYTQHISSVAITHRAQCSHHHVVSSGKMNRMFCDWDVSAAHRLHHAICLRWLNLIFSIDNKWLIVTKQIL